MDDLAAHGLDAWAFDFAGYGGSDRYDAMDCPPSAAPPLGRAPDAASQIARVVDYIVETTGHERVCLIAHSWGTIAAGLYATLYPERVAALCMFGPVVARRMPDIPEPESVGAWRTVTIEQQLARFAEDVPPGHPPVLIDETLEYWGPAYLASDPSAPSRRPPSVKIPCGPQADVYAAWRGTLPYDPERIVAPLLNVRGAWDRVSNDTDANWLLSRVASPIRKDVKIAKGTHLMHLERSRDALFASVRDFISDIVQS